MEKTRVTEIPDYISEEHWLLQKAISLFEEGDDAEAAILFGQVASFHGELADEARRYLKLIEERTERLFAEGEALVGSDKLYAARRCFQAVSDINGRRCEDAKVWLTRIKYISEKRPTVSEEEKPRLSPFSKATSEIRSSPQTLIKRTPHLDILPPLPISPGSTIDVIVYADDKAVRGQEKGKDIVVKTSANIRFLTIEVHLLVTRHYVIEHESNVKILIIDSKEKRSSSAKFTLQVRSAEDLRELRLFDQPSGITALFFHRGRPCGSVSSDAKIVLSQSTQNGI